MLKFYDIDENYVKYLQTIDRFRIFIIIQIINLFVELFLRLMGSSIMRPYHTL